MDCDGQATTTEVNNSQMVARVNQLEKNQRLTTQAVAEIKQQIQEIFHLLKVMQNRQSGYQNRQSEMTVHDL